MPSNSLLCYEKWVRKSKTWLLFNLEDETNTEEKCMNNK